jgi:hypothetical protein
MGSEFAPLTWVKSLQANNLSAQTVNYSEPIKHFDVLLNPYGERYLESDVSNLFRLCS